MKEIVLSNRMEAVVNMVSPQSFTIADVGCDHAYVSIALMQRNMAKKVIAMDVRKGPLEIATRNVQEYGYKDDIDIRLGDGLEKLCPYETDSIIIAGMGGLLIKGILERGRNIIFPKGEMEQKKRPELILQPQSELREVRTFLYDNAYHIVDENMLMEEGKYYTVIKAVPGCEARYETEPEWLYGKCNLERHHPVLKEYLEKEKQVLADICKHLEETVENGKKKGTEIPIKTMERLESVKLEQAYNHQALAYYEM